MPKFKVLLHGQNYEMRVQEKSFLFRNQSVWKIVGFYTTRFIESNSMNEAAEEIIKTIRAELNKTCRANVNSTLEISKIQEDEDAYNLYAPGKGFTFYSEDM